MNKNINSVSVETNSQSGDEVVSSSSDQADDLADAVVQDDVSDKREKLQAIPSAFARSADIDAALAIVLPGISYSSDDRRFLEEALHSSRRQERSSAREMLSATASAEGQRILANLRADPQLRFSDFAARRGLLDVFRLVSALQDSMELRHVLHQNLPALLILANRMNVTPLDCLAPDRDYSGESPMSALVSPEYLGRMSEEKTERLYKIFGPLLTENSAQPSTLIPANALFELSAMSVEQLQQLRALVAWLKVNVRYEISSWSEVYDLQHMQVEGKLPADLLSLLKSKRDLVQHLTSQVTIGDYDEGLDRGSRTPNKQCKMALTTLVDLLRRPEWTMENIVWLEQAVSRDYLERLIDSDTRSQEERNRDFLAKEPRGPLLEGIQKALEGRKNKLELRLRKAREYDLRLIKAAGQTSSRGDARPEIIEQLLRLEDIDVESLLAQVARLPLERQGPFFWYGRPAETIDDFTEERRTEFLRMIAENAGTDATEAKQNIKEEEEEQRGADMELMRALRDAFPKMPHAESYRVKYLAKSLRVLGLGTPDVIRQPETQERLGRAVAALEKIGAHISYGNLVEILDANNMKAAEEDSLLPTLYQAVYAGSDSLGDGVTLGRTFSLGKNLTPAQRALLGDGGREEGTAASPEVVAQARAYLQAVLLLDDGSRVELIEGRHPLTAERIVVGPELLRLLEAGLADESSIDGLVNVLLSNRSQELASRPYAEIDRKKQEKSHMYAVVQSPKFLEFVELFHQEGVDLIEDTRTLADHLRGHGFPHGEEYKDSPLYTAYRLYHLDLQHNEVLSRLLSWGIKIPPGIFKALALEEFLTWPELQRAAANPAVGRFLERYGEDFSFLLPHDLVVINERIVPRIATGALSGFLDSPEYKAIRACLQGDGPSALPRHLRYNYQSFRPATLAMMLELSEKGIDIMAALKEGEKLAQKTKQPARPNDAMLWLQREWSPLVKELYEKPASASAKLSREIRPVYDRETRSGEYTYKTPELEQRFTRPALERMHPVTKAKAVLLLEALKNPAFVRNLKRLTLESWDREYPCTLERDPEGNFTTVVQRNLMGEEAGAVSAMDYDNKDFSPVILDGHTHPTVIEGKPARYNTTPSGMDTPSGDLETTRTSRGGFMVTMSPNQSALSQRLKYDSGLFVKMLEDIGQNPEKLDRIKINVDFFYLDIPDHRKSNLDMGVY